MKKQLAQGAAVSLLLQVCLAAEEPMSKGYTIPTIDLAKQTHRQVIVDREKGQYLGHPTSGLLEDKSTWVRG